MHQDPSSWSSEDTESFLWSSALSTSGPHLFQKDLAPFKLLFPIGSPVYGTNLNKHRRNQMTAFLHCVRRYKLEDYQTLACDVYTKNIQIKCLCILCILLSLPRYTVCPLSFLNVKICCFFIYVWVALTFIWHLMLLLLKDLLHFNTCKASVSHSNILNSSLTQ